MRMVSRESAKTAKSASRHLTSDLFRLPSSELCYLFRPPVKTSEVFSDLDPFFTGARRERRVRSTIRRTLDIRLLTSGHRTLTADF